MRSWQGLRRRVHPRVTCVSAAARAPFGTHPKPTRNGCGHEPGPGPTLSPLNRSGWEGESAVPETEGASAVDSGHPAGTGVLLAACVSSLVVNANTSAVTILLPAISEDLNAPIDQLQWAVTGYMLVGAAVIVTSGALGDVFGRRKVFLGGLALFIASCALIALSTSATGVIGGRVIPGGASRAIPPGGVSPLPVAAPRP